MKFFLEEDINCIFDSLKNKSNKLSGKNILISGGAGFLGTYFVQVINKLNERKFKKPCKVHIIDRFIDKEKKKFLNKNKNFSFTEKDVSKHLSIKNKFDYIIHAAGIPTPSEYKIKPIETLDVSYFGTRYLLDIAKKMNAKFIFFSSSEIYGNPDKKHIPTPESYRGYVATTGGRSCYDEGKRIGETLSFAFHEHFGIHTNCIRPFNVYGPGMLQSDQRVLPNFALNILKNKPLKVFQPGTQTRTYCYVTDAMIGFFLVLLNGLPGEIYNIGTGSPEITVLDLVKRVDKNINKKINYQVIEYPDDYPDEEPQRRCPDLRKSRIQLGYKPNQNINNGLKKFFSWALENYKA